MISNHKLSSKAECMKKFDNGNKQTKPIKDSNLNMYSESNGVVIPIKDGNYVEISVGTPQKIVRVKIDTQQPFTWIVDKRCRFCFFYLGMSGMSNTTGSKSYKVSDVAVSEIVGKSIPFGLKVNEMLEIGGRKSTVDLMNVVYRDIDVPKSFYIENQKVHIDVLDSFLWEFNFPAFNGVLGLGYPYTEEDPSEKRFFSKGTSLMYNMAINKYVTIDLRDGSKSLSLGFVNLKNISSDISWTTKARKNTFEFKLDYIIINNVYFKLNVLAVVNPRYKNSYIPEFFLDKIKLIQKCRDLSVVPPIVFGINNKNFTIGPELYLKPGVVSCTYLFDKIEGNILNSQKTWILGQNFLGKYVAFFDFENKKVGFAN
ncbi:hypothetical protein BB559_005825 [Furculomyces boomerangus]|uniref:Peptidase A1 domain-containing protein n=1 Tax=Furculomyces boomerangus TaxID=61424 RepID=A0A2T9Y6F4_9FUNG|nr:hypothetical protein BB559_005825 [Furculomyces boomerangus]